jgi:hypothetical protein
MRQPIKTDDIDEEERWRSDWINKICPDGGSNRVPPFDQIPRFKPFLDENFGRKKWSPRAKRWWTKEIEEERGILSEARRTMVPGSDQFKQARNR